MYLDELKTVCDKHGLRGDDFEQELDAYLRAGTLSGRDRFFLDGLGEATNPGKQLAWVRARVGPKALRIAWIAFVTGTGGTPVDPPGGTW